ncbi:Ras guanine nucleotide exchange factor I [Smittium mucronatum]|uniref:Ras guanine nucleotide exchange factor I n=1 Tax=Smittium mucronatum TaxID=133383 RepID=A0A1R0H2G7_9FUNG|nr:Ras guanine nucleotide exchange factor I [Smittium mucronatum]
MDMVSENKYSDPSFYSDSFECSDSASSNSSVLSFKLDLDSHEAIRESSKSPPLFEDFNNIRHEHEEDSDSLLENTTNINMNVQEKSESETPPTVKEDSVISDSVEIADSEDKNISDSSSFGLEYVKDLFSSEKIMARKKKKREARKMKRRDKDNNLLSPSPHDMESGSDSGKESRKFSVPFLRRKTSQLSGYESQKANLFNGQVRKESYQMIKKTASSTPVGKREKLIGKIFGEDVDKSEIKKFVKKSEKLWFLEPEYIKFDLSFDMEGKVNGGTWSALIEYLTPPGKNREEPLNLNTSQRKIWEEKKEKPVKLKVFVIFLEWFEHYWYEEEDNECLPRILQFFNEIKDQSMIPSKECKKAINRIETTLEETLGINREDLCGVEETTHKELSELEKRISNTSFNHQSEISFDNRDVLCSDSENTSGSEFGSPEKRFSDQQRTSNPVSENAGRSNNDSDIAELLRVTIGVDLSFEAYKHLSHIAQINPEDVASQLTILQSECYCNISPIELIRNEFSKKEGSKAIHVKQMSTWSNQISRWVAALILYEKSPEKRSRVIKYFLELGLECLHIKNYDAVMAIQSALNSSAILRLKKTWEILPRKSESIIKKLQIATDPSRNYAQYRAVLKKSSPPLLPFLGLYLTDLTFICDGNPDMRRRKMVLGINGISEKEFEMQREKENLVASDIKGPSKDIDIRQKDILINFDKHYKVAQIIMQIQKYQIAYSGNFTMAIPGLQEYILNQIEYWDKENYDDDKLYNLSLEREPRAQMNILNVNQNKSRKKSVGQSFGFSK